MKRVTLLGAIMLSFLATLPNIIEAIYLYQALMV